MIGTLYNQLGQAYINSNDGYDVFQKVQQESDWQTAYPVFKAVEDYSNTVQIPTKTTGWYLPSIGEWVDIMGALGGLDVSTIQSVTDAVFDIAGGAQNAANQINNALKKIGGDYVDTFSTSGIYWSSSEYTKDYAYCIGFFPEKLMFGSGQKWYTQFNVRCVLAF